jgi:hypothetical protein
MEGEGELGRCLPSELGVRARTVVIRPPTPKGNASLGCEIERRLATLVLLNHDWIWAKDVFHE